MANISKIWKNRSGYTLSESAYIILDINPKPPGEPIPYEVSKVILDIEQALINYAPNDDYQSIKNGKTGLSKVWLMAISESFGITDFFKNDPLMPKALALLGQDKEEEKQLQTSELSELKPTTSPLDDLSTWQDFKKKSEQAIDKYPEWKAKQTRKIQKSHLDDFIKPITSNTREIEFIKKLLSEKYNL